MRSTSLKFELLSIFLILFSEVSPGRQVVTISGEQTSLNSEPAAGSYDNISSRGIIEVAHGQAFVKWDNAWAWIFSSNYLYRINSSIALGGGAGLQFDNTGLYPVVSANSIIGHKSDGFAFGADVRLLFTRQITPGNKIWFTGGAYYKDFFVKMMPIFLFGYPREWYFEVGYSFNLGK